MFLLTTALCFTITLCKKDAFDDKMTFAHELSFVSTCARVHSKVVVNVPTRYVYFSSKVLETLRAVDGL